MNLQTTLKDVASDSKTFEEFAEMLPNFLDEFYAHPNATALSEEPALMADRMARGYVLDAYLAATAEELSRQFSFPIPAWVYGAARISQKPFFTMHSPAGRLFVLAYTPPAFKTHNLFVGPEPLSRV